MLLSVMFYCVKVQNFNLQPAYRLYAARRTVGVVPDCRYIIYVGLTWGQ